LRAAALDPSLAVQDVLLFGNDYGGPVELVEQPGTLDLVYASISQGVRRLRYLGAQVPPVAAATATPAYGQGDLLVGLSAAGSHDPENQDLTYAWDLGDGDSASGPLVQHSYTGTGTYDAVLTVTDTEGLTSQATVRITPNNTPPAVTALTAPLDGGLFD